MIRLKSLPQGRRIKANENHDVHSGTIKTKRAYKDKGKSLKSQNYGSFEAILEWNNGKYRIKEIVSI